MADEVVKSDVAEPEREDGKDEGTEEEVATATVVDPVEVN